MTNLSQSRKEIMFDEIYNLIHQFEKKAVGNVNLLIDLVQEVAQDYNVPSANLDDFLSNWQELYLHDLDKRTSFYKLRGNSDVPRLNDMRAIGVAAGIGSGILASSALYSLAIFYLTASDSPGSLIVNLLFIPSVIVCSAIGAYLGDKSSSTSFEEIENIPGYMDVVKYDNGLRQLINDSVQKEY